MNPFITQNYIQYQMMVRSALIQSHLQSKLYQEASAPIHSPERNSVEQNENCGSESAYYSEGGSDNDSLASGQLRMKPGFSPEKCDSRPMTAAITLQKKCSFCPATFKSNTDVKRHDRIHTGEKPFSCSVCKKTFNRKGNMEKHMTTHFKGRDRLMKLKAAQATDKSFICHCGKAFKSRGFFARHQRQHEFNINRTVSAQFTPEVSQTQASDMAGLPSFVIKALAKRAEQKSRQIEEIDIVN